MFSFFATVREAWFRQNRSWLTIGVGLCLLMGVSIGMWTLDANVAAQPRVQPASAQAISLNFVPFASGFSSPVKIANAGDNRLFVVERAGKIFVVQANGTKLATPFLDITARVGSVGTEQGLLGMVFEPNNLKTFYVNYTNKQGNTVIARYKVTGADLNQADANSEQIVLTVNQPFENHNAGDLAFGPDGYLYIPLGDGGSGGDPQDRAQKLSELLGKILRINVIGQTTYTIPNDNPYVNDNDPNTRGEIWAYGLRNPWRFSFDRQTGDMWIGDVGQNLYEEIDFQPANSKGGENYGWDCYEGTHVYSDTTQSVPCNGQYQLPVTDYSHADGSAVTGGYLYRGARYPNLVGHYLFADYGSGNFWILTANGQRGWTPTLFAHQAGWPSNPSTFGEDVNGELYVADLGGGVIYHIEEQSAVNTTPTATATNPPTGTLVPTVPTLPPFTPKAAVNLPLIRK